MRSKDDRSGTRGAAEAKKEGARSVKNLGANEFHMMLYTRIRHGRACLVARPPTSIDISDAVGIVDGQRSSLIRILPRICPRHRAPRHARTKAIAARWNV